MLFDKIIRYEHFARTDCRASTNIPRPSWRRGTPPRRGTERSEAGWVCRPSSQQFPVKNLRGVEGKEELT